MPGRVHGAAVLTFDAVVEQILHRRGDDRLRLIAPQLSDVDPGLALLDPQVQEVTAAREEMRPGMKSQSIVLRDRCGVATGG